MMVAAKILTMETVTSQCRTGLRPRLQAFDSDTATLGISVPGFSKALDTQE